MRIDALTTMMAAVLSVPLSEAAQCRSAGPPSFLGPVASRCGTRAVVHDLWRPWSAAWRKGTNVRSSQQSTAGSSEGTGQGSPGANAQGGSPVPGTGDDGIHVGVGSGRGRGPSSGGQRGD